MHFILIKTIQNQKLSFLTVLEVRINSRMEALKVLVITKISLDLKDILFVEIFNKIISRAYRRIGTKGPADAVW